MSTQALRRKSVRIASSRWTTYAVAGAASSLAALGTAEAEIHYSGPLNVPLKGSISKSFPLEGGAALVLRHTDEGAQGGIAHAAIGGAASLFAGDCPEITSNAPFYLYRLGSQVTVSQERLGHSCISFSSSSSTTVECFGAYLGFTDYPGVHFMQPGRGFIGFEFNTGAGPQYGWLRVKTNGAPDFNFIVIDYAWGDPGDVVKTGQKTSAATDQAVTNSGSLGLLAVGGKGLQAWRRQRPGPGKLGAP